MQLRTAELDLRGAIFSVRLSDLLARERILTSADFNFEREPSPGDKEGTLIGCREVDEPAADKLVERAQKLWLQSNKDPALPGSLNQHMLNEGHEIANDLATLITTSLNAERQQQLQINKAVAYVLIRSVERAAEEVDDVLTRDRANQRALLLKGRINFYCGDLRAARSVVMNVRAVDMSQPLLILAEGCVASGDHEQARTLYSRIGESSASQQYARARLLRLSETSRDQVEVGKIVEWMKSEECLHPMFELTLAEYLFATGDLEDAVQRLVSLECVSTTPANARLWYAWQLGRMRFLSGSFLTACDWYARVAADENDSLPHREYVHALYRAGLMPAAYRRARAIRAKCGRAVHGITEIEADTLAQGGNFEGARGLIIELVADRPRSAHLLLSLARLYAATGDVDKARDCLKEIDPEKVQPSLELELKSLISELNQLPE